ncbi:MAG TPA: serine/threonine-protein kinase [Kofleriaceae bacterium]|jgi:serine/threonine-protein kinase|nr:serine/threonine-protein kinase [Kofleriaceae bacterium]
MQTVGGRYVLEGHLGAGAMGEVYRVRHVSLGKAFALKVISPAFANDGVARERFNHEAKLASEITHANIVSIVDFGEDPTLGAYMVMELVDGEPLLDPNAGPMPVRRALDVMAQVADALDCMHKRGIVHGDVKAENILLAAEVDSTHGSRRRRVVRLLDFGLAHVLGNGEDGISGSPHYIAPERAQGGPATPLTDVYALGVLGFVLLTHTVPFDGNVMEILTAHVQQQAPTLSSRRGEQLDDAVEGLVARAMAKDPAARHPSASAFRYELNNVMDMLDLGRRQRKSQPIAVQPREHPNAGMLVKLFEESPYAQALIAFDGAVAIANQAFARLVGDHEVAGRNLAETTLARDLPAVLAAIRVAASENWPTECRARISASMELVVWVAPAPAIGKHVHMIARIAESD